MRLRTAALAAGVSLLFGTVAGVALAQPAFVTASVADAGRPANDTARDVNRKPAQVLAFAGVKPGDKVGEIMPGGGYYTRLLAKIVGTGGKLYAIMPPPRAGGPPGGGGDALKAIGPQVTVISSPNLAPTAEITEKLDLIWTSENYHDFHNSFGGGAPADIAAFNKAVFDALKPGGVFLVEDHAAANDAPPTATSALHRINPNQAIAELTAAGFRLEARSDVLRNPNDDHTKPGGDPSIRGQTDKFLLKLRKPG